MELTTAAIPALAGVASHLLYFNHGEHHLYAKLYSGTIFLGSVVSLAIILLSGEPIRSVHLGILSVVGWYLLGLYGSILAYRLFLHPLRKFPGPFWARASTLWFSTGLRKQDAHKQVHALHQKYGEFVRIGSSDLSVTHREGVSAIYGPSSKCVKGGWYDLNYPVRSLQTTRDKHAHTAARRVWSAAFGDRQLRGYEERMKGYRDKLIQHISEAASAGSVVDVTKWFGLYNFDVMGDMAFGQPFGMLDSSEKHWAIEILEAGLAPLGFHLPIWALLTMKGIPGLSAKWWRFVRYCNQLIRERLEAKPGKPDIISALLQPWEGREITPDGITRLEGDSKLIVVAGSDTTTTTTTLVFYYLVKHPEHIAKLREELDPYFQDGSLDSLKIHNLSHLNGVINETLRLYPPVPTALHRLTPPEGITVGDTHIPGNMTVWCPQYAIGRTESLYPEPNSFIPKRWYSRPDLVVDKSVFAPFSTGAYACIGKSLALQNLRITIAEIVMRFDVAVGSEKDVETLDDKITEHFTLGLPPLRLAFSPRQR